MFGGECEEYEDWQVQSQNLLELSVLPVRNIPHVLGELTPRFENRPEQGTLQNRSFFVVSVTGCVCLC